MISGKLYPFVFITIACGAISGFHALISSGTTPKMIAKETDARMIGYGSMLMEGIVGVVALIAATSLFPGDYFAINTAQRTDAQKAAYTQMVATHSTDDFNLQPQEIDRLEQESGEKNLRGRTGGAVTLALGIAKIFAGIPGLGGLMKYWYHFAIMFEALFILTTIDTGTRVARFLVGEFGGRFYQKLEEPNWVPGSIVTSLLVVSAWACVHLVRIYLDYLADVWYRQSTLAAVALCVATTILINSGKARYAWVTISAANVRRQYYSCRRMEVDHRYLLAAVAKSGDVSAGLHQHQSDCDHHGRRDSDHDRLDTKVAGNAPQTRNNRRDVTNSCSVSLESHPSWWFVQGRSLTFPSGIKLQKPVDSSSRSLFLLAASLGVRAPPFSHEWIFLGVTVCLIDV